MNKNLYIRANRLSPCQPAILDLSRSLYIQRCWQIWEWQAADMVSKENWDLTGVTKQIHKRVTAMVLVSWDWDDESMTEPHIVEVWVMKPCCGEWKKHSESRPMISKFVKIWKRGASAKTKARTSPTCGFWLGLGDRSVRFRARRTLVWISRKY